MAYDMLALALALLQLQPVQPVFRMLITPATAALTSQVTATLVRGRLVQK